MSNSTTIDLARAVEIILTMDRYMLIILYITGMIGAILNIITFLQKQIRINPCSVYFLSTSIIDFCIMNIFILMEILTTFNKPLSNLIYSTRIWCKFGNYLMSLCPCLSSSYITLASFDRFCVSSLNQTLRKWSKLKISRIVVTIVFIIWALFELHIPISYDRIPNPTTQAIQCRVAIGSPTAFLIMDGFFFALFNGVIIPFLLCIFGLLIYYNMKQSRNRVNIQQRTRTHRTTTGAIPIILNRTTTTIGVVPIILNKTRLIQNRNSTHMLCMLLVQVFVTILLNIPYIVIYLFNFFNLPPQDLFLLLIYIIFSFIARWFYYMNYCKTFYINTLTSGLFRKSLRQQFLNLFHRHERI